MQVCLLSPTCLIPTEEVDPDRVAELQAQIAQLQDAVDEYNATNDID